MEGFCALRAALLSLLPFPYQLLTICDFVVAAKQPVFDYGITRRLDYTTKLTLNIL